MLEPGEGAAHGARPGRARRLLGVVLCLAGAIVAVRYLLACALVVFGVVALPGIGSFVLGEGLGAARPRAPAARVDLPGAALALSGGGLLAVVPALYALSALDVHTGAAAARLAVSAVVGLCLLAAAAVGWTLFDRDGQ